MIALTRAPLAMADLEHVVSLAADDLGRFRRARLLVTGATGFVGGWVVESLVHANRRMGLGMEIVALVRDPTRVPDADVTTVVGDVRSFAVDGAVDGVIHAAASSRAPFGVGDGEPAAMFDTIVNGTARTLAVAATSGRIPFLLVSSGAVYGPSATTGRITEDQLTGPDPTDPRSAYAEGKRAAELLASLSGTGTIARGFAFTGPLLPLDAHFAAGNFVADVVAGRPVRVNGDGSAVRSYLYAADLAVWLFAILARGAAGRAYNVGSERPVSIGELAWVAAAAGRPPVPAVIKGATVDAGAGNTYVPSTERARTELGVAETIGLEDGLRRTIEWASQQ